MSMYFFTVKSFKCDEVEAGSIEMHENVKRVIRDKNGNIMKNTKCKIITVDGTEKSVTSNNKGIIEVIDIVPGKVKVIPEDE